MSDNLSFWDAIAPYLNYIEDNYLDLDSITYFPSGEKPQLKILPHK